MILKIFIHQFRVLSLIVVLICSFSFSVSSQVITASSPKDSLSVGEIFNISIKLQQDQVYDRIVFPDSGAFPNSIEWIETKQFRVTDFADSVLYSLQFFSNKDISLPPFAVILITNSDTTVAYSNPVKLNFKTVLPSEDAEFKPLKPIFDFKGIPWLLVSIIIAVLFAIAFIIYTLRKKNEEVSAPIVRELIPFKNPILELENSLLYLKNKYDLAATKDYKFFYTALGDSIRTYFEDLYRIPALESTSRELFRYLDAFGVDHEMIKSTRKVLNRSDMVKFAKFTPTLDDAWNCYQFAFDFLDRARIVDASRIERKRAEHEFQYAEPEFNEQQSEEAH